MNLLAIDFINSQWYSKHEGFEPLSNKEWVQMLFKLWHIPCEFDLSEGKSREFIELREWLFTIVQDISTNQVISNKYINEVNSYLSKSEINLSLAFKNDRYDIETIPLECDWNWVINSIILSFIKLFNVYDIDRIRVCSNPECKIVFYDKSKNKTKKFCKTSCANVVKVRRHRAKQNNSKN